MIRMNKRFRCFWVFLVTALCGCDGSITVEGIVLAPPAEASIQASRVFVDKTPSHTTGWIPVPNAQVWLYRSPEDSLPGRDQFWADDATTDSKGHFRVSATACPCKLTALLRVRSSTFDEVDQAFPHESISAHSAVVLLRRTRVSRGVGIPVSSLTGVAAGGGVMGRAEALASLVSTARFY
jgi:hypothetical protein